MKKAISRQSFLTLCFALSLPLIALNTANTTANTLSQEQSEAQLATLKSNITKVNRWLVRANKEKSGLIAELEKHDREISKISRKIREVKAQTSIFSSELKALESEQKKNKANLKQHHQFLIKHLRAAYIYGEQPELKTLLNLSNPQNIALDMHYFASIKDAQNEEIQAVQQALDKIRDTEKNILSKKLKLDKHQQLLTKNQTAIKASQKKQKVVLNKLKSSIKNNKDKLNKLKADQKRLENLLQEIEQAIAAIPIPEDASPFHKRKGKLPWPARGKLNSRFGTRILQGKLKRNGITIATRDNQEVKATHAGRVIFSNWIRGFGLLIIVDHGNNYMTLYGNNKSITKETGDWVRANEIIAYAQESSTEPESGLYFEIRKHGKPINPIHWLSK